MKTRESVLCVVTNNPEAERLCEGREIAVVQIDGMPLDVLDKAEALLQSAWKLVSAPLPPNIPMMRAPYRSLLLERNERRYDSAGILSIAAARERFTAQSTGERASAAREDFAAIDAAFLERALRDMSLL
ncbi:MAG: GrdX family protein [Synergistaceae bacterium]|nr:GrdX family protein [Synergistaceae bacterium]